MPSKYRVTAGTSVLDHAPQSVFEADLPEDHERRLLASGALQSVRSDAQTKAGEEPAAMGAEPKED